MRPNRAGSDARRQLFVEALRFALVGGVGFIVNAGLMFALAGSIGPVAAQMLAFPAAMTTTWALNRHFTFRASRRAHAGSSGLAREWVRYAGANAIGFAANNAVCLALLLSVPAVHALPVLAVVAGSMAGMGLNFTTARRYVFAPAR